MIGAEGWRDPVERIVRSTPVHDIHTHLYDPHFRSLMRWGIDEQLVYHYLISETAHRVSAELPRFLGASKADQADWVWRELFVEHSPVSEACRGVVTTLNVLGLDPRRQDLPALRRWFAEQDPDGFVDQVLTLARVDRVAMTNSPFDDEERALWFENPQRDPRFIAALRIDPLVLAWPTTVARLRSWGYDVTEPWSAATASEVRRFLAEWARRIRSEYCMVSLPPDFVFPGTTTPCQVLEEAVLPHAREFGQPLALMMGVKRGVNPVLGMAGDGVGTSQLSSLQALCGQFPENRFLATALARENQHELVVLARKFPNLHLFGCWWFTNTPQLMHEITTMRLDLLGTNFTFQHSDARVVDQLIYKWEHARCVLTDCLTQRYERLEASGWCATEAEITRDVTELMGGGFRRFLGR